MMDMTKTRVTRTQHSIQKVIGSGYAVYRGSIFINILSVTTTDLKIRLDSASIVQK